ncbi:MAG: hypothetical protein PHQ95_03265 [Candidatus Gracilibacteria bacterium]|nr:hypothetical protein [Candidatus Gracilibacteria bacterium]
MQEILQQDVPKITTPITSSLPEIIEGTRERTESSLDTEKTQKELAENKELMEIIKVLFNPNGYNIHDEVFLAYLARSMNSLVNQGLWPARTDELPYTISNSLPSLKEIKNLIGTQDFDEKFPHLHEGVKTILQKRHNLSQ